MPNANNYQNIDPNEDPNQVKAYKSLQRDIHDVRKEFRNEHADQFVPRQKIIEKIYEKQKNRSISNPKEHNPFNLDYSIDDADIGGHRMSLYDFLSSRQTLKDLFNMIIIGACGLVGVIFMFIIHRVFNELTVSIGFYIGILFAIVWAIQNNKIPFVSINVDFPALYAKELEFPKSQVSKGFWLAATFMLPPLLLLLVSCGLGYYELSEMTLLIPALKSSIGSIKIIARVAYLTLYFLEFVVFLPIVEQRYIFIFLSNLISEMQFLQKLISLFPDYGLIVFISESLKRNGVVNIFTAFTYHCWTFLPVVYLNFDNNQHQQYFVWGMLLAALMIIHLTRLKYGVLASITAHMVFNFCLWTILVVIYFSDVLHAGFDAENHTTVRQNAIDYIFGQNEDYAANI